MGDYYASSDPRYIKEARDHNKIPNRDPHIAGHRGNRMDTNRRSRQVPHKQMPRCTGIEKIIIKNTNS